MAAIREIRRAAATRAGTIPGIGAARRTRPPPGCRPKRASPSPLRPSPPSRPEPVRHPGGPRLGQRTDPGSGEDAGPATARERQAGG